MCFFYTMSQCAQKIKVLPSGPVRGHDEINVNRWIITQTSQTMLLIRKHKS